MVSKIAILQENIAKHKENARLRSIIAGLRTTLAEIATAPDTDAHDLKAIAKIALADTDSV